MLQITISGSINFGPSWDDLQQLVCGMMNKPGVFTRIARQDKGVNYRAQYGVYDVTFIPIHGDAVDIEVTVNRQPVERPKCPTCGSTEGAYVPPGSGDAQCLHCGADWPLGEESR